jgi:hypothetical protein
MSKNYKDEGVIKKKKWKNAIVGIEDVACKYTTIMSSKYMI